MKTPRAGGANTANTANTVNTANTANTTRGAAERVAASRRAITEVLSSNTQADAPAGMRGPQAHPGRTRGLLAEWAWAASQPGGGAHPLRDALSLGHALAQERLAPLVERHPFAWVGAAALAGALFAAVRPWRWALRPVMATSLLGLVSRAALRALAAPSESRPP
jgi:hypothetical protein